MKKIALILVMGVMLSTVATAQTDTIPWKYDKYHYSVWYDTLPEFFTYWACYPNIPALQLYEWEGYDYPGHVTAFPQHVDRPTLVQGVAVTEPLNYYYWSIIRNQRYIEEYVYLFQKVGDTVELIDSVRWDTITPKVMTILLNADTQKYGIDYVKVYEAMFDEPIMVDSVFYTVSSNNGGTAHCGSSYYAYEYYPVSPMSIYNHGLLRDPSWCPMPSWWSMKDWDIKNTRQWGNSGREVNSPIFGLYFPIVDYVELIVEPADTVMGTTEPSSIRVSRNITQRIHAVPKHGYRFSHWQEDGDTNATRNVVITQDTTRFTAVFEPLEMFDVEVESSDHGLGYVTGGGSYYEGDEAVIRAVAHAGNHFERWNDSVTENPRTIVVAHDTSFTAIFKSGPLGVSEGELAGVPLQLVPNPASSVVRCETIGKSFGGGVLTMTDALGREVIHKELAPGAQECTFSVADLPAGTYMVTLTTKEGSETRRLVVQ